MRIDTEELIIELIQQGVTFTAELVQDKIKVVLTTKDVTITSGGKSVEHALARTIKKLMTKRYLEIVK